MRIIERSLWLTSFIALSVAPVMAGGSKEPSSAAPAQTGTAFVEQSPEPDGLSLEEAIEQSAAEVLKELPGGTRVAIAAFSSEHENLSNYIMDELAGALVDGSLEVADRRNLAYVYRELNFQMSGDVSDKSAVSIGKFLGARYVITGQLVKAGDRYRYRISGINVETAVQESSTRLNVRADRALQNLIAGVRRSPAVTVAASYGEHQTGTARTAGSYLDSGIRFAVRGDYDTAIAEFTEAINLDGNLAAAYMLRGRAYFASVSQVYSVERNFDGLTTISTRGNVSSDKRTIYNQAIADYTQAVRLDPNNAATYRQRGVTYGDIGDYDRAIADYNQAIRLDPNYAASAYSNRGVTYDAKGDHDRAIADYNQAIRLYPNAITYYNRGNAYNAKGDYDRAIADYNQAIRLDPNYASAYSNRGIAYAEKGDYDRAIADYNQAIRLDPNFASAYYSRGLVYYDKKDYDRAIADYTQAIRLDPNYASAYNNRGNAYNAKGDYNRAVSDYETALRINPDLTIAKQNLEIVRRRQQGR
jgi:tetratricopeptide (TPR) repeat protein